MSDVAVTERTRVRRGRKKASYNRDTINSIIDEAWVCNIGVSVDGQAMVQPSSHWRVGDELFLHGSVKNGLFQQVMKGQTACITLCLLDGLVFARSAYHHSVNFRSMVLYGKGRLVENLEEKRTVLDAMLDKYSPGRSLEARPPNGTEMKVTAVFAFPIEEVSVKVSAGGPNDDPEDMALDVWSGVKPVTSVVGELIPD
ncbi:pyridoxamine 5'-phosphate oxidase family protein [Amphritea sp. 2_MG-2023]|uniref:pyridoxamine 5'-phosphate oxidase family protein n=1 Tax=Amphritea TaxID=515417 RepID=UPI001C079E45|nr:MULTISPECIES: pyridoxamine 5'-phosphate oxidase family protein [Amphritea]MBU2966787.1 pyridoxamine 5'-phosphate oxidase family protein [Amphritea atlantica]MDO6420682.1 pyridoxamine 5'-phosphate oxidase family protein [Amphritea sp. 2_MG-2023]